MNSLSTIALWLVAAQCALVMAQYGPAQSSYPQQRKMAPSPQYQRESSSPSYGQSSYSQKAAPAPSYSRQQAPPAGPSSGYGAPAASQYAPAKPKYEEPYYPPMPFAWGYDINDGYGGAQFHKESGDEYGKRTGSYGYTDAYGIYRQVDYVADENGFRATVKTNEPGTANEAPADVEWHAYEPPSNHYAGQQQSYAAAGPAPASTYSKPAPRPSYSAPPPAPRPTYSSPAPAPRPTYSQAPAYKQAQPQQYQQAREQPQYQMSPYSSEQSYSSSQNVPIYTGNKQAISSTLPAQRRNSY